MSKYATTPQQQRIADAFGSEQYIIHRMDVQTGSLWDSLSFTAGATSPKARFTPLFVHVGPGSAKGYVDTNMHNSSTLSASQAFAIERVVFSFDSNCDSADLFQLAESTVWELWTGDKYYLRSLIIAMIPFENTTAPIRICNYCHGVYVQAASCPGCGAREFGLSTMGQAPAFGRRFMLTVNPVLVIENQMRFRVELDSSPVFTLRGPLKMWCHLEGLHARGVQ